MLNKFFDFLANSVLGEIWPYIAGAVASLAAVAGAYLKGRNDQSSDEELKRAYDYQETRERMDEVDPAADADAARERLRNRKS